MSLHVWRIGYSGALTLVELGRGSTMADGRWHVGCSGAQQVVYCGSTRALCQLEKRVHCNGAMPKNLALLRLEVPGSAKLIDLKLPADWRTNQGATQTLGMEWLAAASSLGMWVPSFVEPAEKNLLLNPAHPDYLKVKLEIEANPFVFDPRLFD